jgi:DNA processing protein
VNEDSRYWLALLRAPGVGPRLYCACLERFGSPAALFGGGKIPADLPDAAISWLKAPDWSVVEADLVWLAEPDSHLICIGTPAYPRLLSELPDPPPVLFARGDPTLLHRPQLAIVGSRNPTPIGVETATAFARHLAGAGLVITSGLALGIDAAAHAATLDAGGVTLAVAGTGLDRVYPAAHQALARRIAATGLLVSEFPPGTPPRPENFPRRNRIISGLTLGTLVVEATPRSGSLITARYAMEQGREVFAIPGSIHNPQSRGCHQLIRQGAKLVETATDILEELGPLAGVLTDPEPLPQATPVDDDLPDDDYAVLLNSLDDTPLPIDVLAARSGLTPEAVSSMLLILELRGRVASVPGGRYARSRNERS